MSYKKLKKILEANLNQVIDKLDPDKLYDLWIKSNQDQSYDLSYSINEMSDEMRTIMYNQARQVLAKDSRFSRFDGTHYTLSGDLKDLEDSGDDTNDVYMYDPLGILLTKTEMFKKFMTDRVVIPMFDDFTKSIRSYIKNGSITLYRMQVFNPAEGADVSNYAGDYVTHLINFGGRLGKHWTNEPASIANFEDTLKSGKKFNMDDYLLEISVKEEYIDWMSTIVARFNYEFGQSGHEDYKENEVVLFKNTPVKIINLSRYNENSEDFDSVPEDDDMRKIRSKVFYV